MAVTINRQELRLDGITSILVSDVTPDADSGGYVRRIDFFQDPTSLPNRAASLTVYVYAPTQKPIDITIPSGVVF